MKLSEQVQVLESVPEGETAECSTVTEAATKAAVGHLALACG